MVLRGARIQGRQWADGLSLQEALELVENLLGTRPPQREFKFNVVDQCYKTQRQRRRGWHLCQGLLQQVDRPEMFAVRTKAIRALTAPAVVHGIRAIAMGLGSHEGVAIIEEFDIAHKHHGDRFVNPTSGLGRPGFGVVCERLDQRSPGLSVCGGRSGYHRRLPHFHGAVTSNPSWTAHELINFVLSISDGT
jgi:hypothetical protein